MELKPITKILFIDIETVSQESSFALLSERYQELWSKKAEQIKKNADDTPENLYPRAAIYAEFGKIVCISIGFFAEGRFKLRSLYGHDEKRILTDFAALLNRKNIAQEYSLCAHNGKEFDFPYVARRMIINGIPIPTILQVAGKKPWETSFIDTMELWKFGDYKSYTSLDLLTACLGIPTPKDDISGCMVGKVYWEDGDIERISTYCQKDVLAMARVYCRYQGIPLVADELVDYN